MKIIEFIGASFAIMAGLASIGAIIFVLIRLGFYLECVI